MKDLKTLKAEQYSLKAKLHELIEFTNNGEYFTLSLKEKSLINQQRIGMELYLNALTNRVYSKEDTPIDNASVFSLLIGMLSSPLYGLSYGEKEELSKSLEEQKDEDNE